MITNVPIGEASKASGVKVPTIRYYEQIGLLPSPPRSDGNRRLYDRSDIQRLLFIRHARAKLLSLKTELQRMLECTAHGRIDQCRVIEILGNHEECVHPKH